MVLKIPFIPLIELDLITTGKWYICSWGYIFLEFLKPSIDTYIHLGEIMSFMREHRLDWYVLMDGEQNSIED